MDGFEVLDILGKKCPRVIFTTAFDQYAIKAFEVRALDYLLKPFDAERLHTALDRALEDIRTNQGDVFVGKVENLLAKLRKEKPYLRRILLKLAGRIIFVDVSEVERIESEEKYLRLHTGKKTYLYRETLTHLESRLDPSAFVRVHRSQIVNMQFVRELENLSHGDYSIVMKDDARVPLGRTYRDQFLRRLTEGTDPGN
jgi:two-component system LytT family response regulator